MLGLVISILAHGFGGTGGLPLPRWLLAYAIGFAVVIAFVVLRIVWPTPPRAVPRSGRRRPPRPVFAAMRVIGLLLFAGVVIAAAFGENDPAANIAPVTVIVMFWLGLQVVCAVFGDVFWWFNPFATMAAMVP